MPPEEDAKPLAFCTVQWFLYSSDVQFALSLRFLYLRGMETFLIEGLVGRNLSELLHALRQEQGTPRAADVLWKGRSELSRAGKKESVHQTHSTRMLGEIPDVLFSNFGQCVVKTQRFDQYYECQLPDYKMRNKKFSPLLRGSTAHAELTSYFKVKNESNSIRMLKKTLKSG